MRKAISSAQMIYDIGTECRQRVMTRNEVVAKPMRAIGAKHDRAILVPFESDHYETDAGMGITQDELGNTYDRVGGPYSNHKP